MTRTPGAFRLHWLQLARRGGPGPRPAPPPSRDTRRVPGPTLAGEAPFKQRSSQLAYYRSKTQQLHEFIRAGRLKSSGRDVIEDVKVVVSSGKTVEAVLCKVSYESIEQVSSSRHGENNSLGRKKTSQRRRGAQEELDDQGADDQGDEEFREEDCDKGHEARMRPAEGDGHLLVHKDEEEHKIKAPVELVVDSAARVDVVVGPAGVKGVVELGT